MEAKLATLSPTQLAVVDCVLLLFFGSSVLACFLLAKLSRREACRRGQS